MNVTDIVNTRIERAVRELYEIDKLIAESTGRVSITDSELRNLEDNLKANAQRAIHCPIPHKYDFANDEWVKA